MKPITANLLGQLARSPSPYLSQLAQAMNSLFPVAGITTPLRAAHFLGQACYETSRFTRLEENLVYSPMRIAVVWPRLAPRQNELGGNPVKLANAAYANKNGNGDEASGDGWLFRGRGPFMITGRGNYEEAKADQHPDRVAIPEGGMTAAIVYWTSRKIDEAADADDIEKVTELVNGGLLGIAERSDLKKVAFNLLNDA